MALTTTAANNKLIKFRMEVYREYVRENLFSPYMGTSMNAIIRVITDLDKGGKNGGEQINIPLRARLNSAGVGVGPLRGNEEALDNQGTRFWIDWARNAVVINNADEQKSSIDLWAECKPALSCVRGTVGCEPAVSCLPGQAFRANAPPTTIMATGIKTAATQPTRRRLGGSSYDDIPGRK